MKPIAGEAKGAPQKWDVSLIIEKRKSNRFAINLILWTFLIMILEGFDYTVISYAAPVLIKQWQVEESTFGAIFGAGTFGLMVGGLIFGFLGDRLGRKKALICSILLASLFTLASSWASSPTGLMYMRFLACIGLGGTVPLAIVHVNEYAPLGSRGKWVSIMFTGFPVGHALGGLIAAWLIPAFGWQSIFLVGGIAPLLLIIGLLFMLPESLRFLVLKNSKRSKIMKLVSSLKPDLQIRPDAEIVLEEETKSMNFSPRLLFQGSLRMLTPLIWILYILSSFVIYFLNSWLPHLFVSSGLSLENASVATSMYQLAGIVCGFVVGWLFDKRGMLACTIFPGAACLVVALLGYPMPVMFLISLVSAAGFFVIGTQMVLTVTTPNFYPTSYRSKANGMAMSIAKIGSISGPIVGGILLSSNLSIRQLFFLNSAAIALGAILMFTIALLYRRHFKAGKEVTSDQNVA
ncbi:MFS transporter [Ammoniphilus sp. 3BR4]|uniref:MFS transporter n=1 Tax=Ammoniphilus sp. 3BR4 TaxID=3158265 RepID=UPI00346792C4